MNPSTSPELKDMSYADYADAIRREGYLKDARRHVGYLDSLKQAGVRSGRSSNRPAENAVDVDLIK